MLHLQNASLAITHFSLWRKQHHAQNGTQKCNICIHVRRATQQTHARLKRRCHKLTEAKAAKALQEVRAEIQQRKRKQQTESAGHAKSQKQTFEAHPAKHKEANIQMNTPHAHIQIQDTEIPQVNDQQSCNGQDHKNTKKNLPSYWHMNVHIAMPQSTVRWSLDRSMQVATVANDFESRMVWLHVALPINAPDVANRFNQQKKVAEYKASTRHRMEKMYHGELVH